MLLACSKSSTIKVIRSRKNELLRLYSTSSNDHPGDTQTSTTKKETTISQPLKNYTSDVNKTRIINGLNNSIVKVPSPKELKKFLDNYIVGQTTGKKVMSVAVYNHYLRVNDKAKKLAKRLKEQQLKEDDSIYSLSDSVKPTNTGPEQIGFSLDDLEDEDLELSKSNILLLGPSGSGKTLIAKTLARVLNVPFSITDCTQLTQAGYIGEDVELCIERLLINSGYDVEKTEKGIVVLDEVDKLAKPLVASGTKDVAGEGVQQALLKLIEGTQVQVQVKKPVNKDKDGQGNNTATKRNELYHIDTSNILFILMGAFVGLDSHISQRLSKSSIGFEADIDDAEDGVNSKRDAIKQIRLEDGRKVSALELVTPQDLTSYGMIPELIGRVPVITGLDSLDEKNLLSILTEPKNAILSQYKYIFQQFGVKLVITEPALIKISELALKEGTGARGLRGIMERLLLNVNYECPDSGISFVLIDSEIVGTINSGKVEAKYYGRGDLFRLVDDVFEEDKELGKQLQIELGIAPSSNEKEAAASG